MKIEDKLEQIAIIILQRNVLQTEAELKLKQQRKLELEIALERCPFIKGQKVTDKEGVQFFIGTIRYLKITKYAPEGYTFKVRKTKKDGTPFVEQQAIWGMDTSDFKA
tara:strand:+ start:84 stop:407 length:324 start_codon:yes stop_codon:yes gene_type:complete